MFRSIQTILLIVVVYFFGNGISGLIKSFIIVPGNLIGMGILYMLLTLKFVKLEHIKETGDFLLKHMSLFFIPFGVSILNYYDVIKLDLIPLIIIVVVTTSVSMLLSAKVVDFLVKGDKK